MSYFTVTRPQFRALLIIVDNRMIGARNPFRHNHQTIAALFRKGLIVHVRCGIKPSELGELIIRNRRTS